MVNYYHVLGVREFASEKEIHDAFMSLIQPIDGITDGRTRDSGLINKAFKSLTYKPSKTKYEKKIIEDEREYRKLNDEMAIKYAKDQANALALARKAKAKEKEEQKATWDDTMRKRLGNQRRVADKVGPQKDGDMSEDNEMAEGDENEGDGIRNLGVISKEELDALHWELFDGPE
ncbi:MAG: hypothetical protein Q9221_003465 [Calogaya cf. arnoldii]